MALTQAQILALAQSGGIKNTAQATSLANTAAQQTNVSNMGVATAPKAITPPAPAVSTPTAPVMGVTAKAPTTPAVTIQSLPSSQVKAPASSTNLPLLASTQKLPASTLSNVTPTAIPSFTQSQGQLNAAQANAYLAKGDNLARATQTEGVVEKAGNAINKFLGGDVGAGYQDMQYGAPVVSPVAQKTTTPTTTPVTTGTKPTTLSNYYASKQQAVPSLSQRALIYQDAGLGKSSDYEGTKEQNDALLAWYNAGGYQNPNYGKTTATSVPSTPKETPTETQKTTGGGAPTGINQNAVDNFLASIGTPSTATVTPQAEATIPQETTQTTTQETAQGAPQNATTQGGGVVQQLLEAAQMSPAEQALRQQQAQLQSQLAEKLGANAMNPIALEFQTGRAQTLQNMAAQQKAALEEQIQSYAQQRGISADALKALLVQMGPETTMYDVTTGKGVAGALGAGATGAQNYMAAQNLKTNAQLASTYNSQAANMSKNLSVIDTLGPKIAQFIGDSGLNKNEAWVNKPIKDYLSQAGNPALIKSFADMNVALQGALTGVLIGTYGMGVDQAGAMASAYDFSDLTADQYATALQNLAVTGNATLSQFQKYGTLAQQSGTAPFQGAPATSGAYTIPTATDQSLTNPAGNSGLLQAALGMAGNTAGGISGSIGTGLSGLAGYLLGKVKK